MPTPNRENESYFSKYAETAEAVSSFVYQMATTPELVENPCAQFEAIDGMIRQAEPNADFNNNMIVPELLNAQINVARACVEIHLRDLDKAEICLESAFYIAETVGDTAMLSNWISDNIPVESPIYPQFSRLAESARHTLSFDPAGSSEAEWTSSELPEFSPEPEENYQQEIEFPTTLKAIDPAKLDSRLDTIVAAVAKFSDGALIEELFDQLNSQLGETASSQQIGQEQLAAFGAIDAKIHVVRALIDSLKPETPRDKIADRFADAFMRAEYWECLPAVSAWIATLKERYPHLESHFSEKFNQTPSYSTPGVEHEQQQAISNTDGKKELVRT